MDIRTLGMKNLRALDSMGTFLGVMKGAGWWFLDLGCLQSAPASVGLELE